MKAPKTSLSVAALAFCLATGCTTPGSSAAPAMTAADAHNARNALDWAGTYRGVLPCADCEGIETTLNITGDSAYTMQSKYLGKGAQTFSERGKITWNAAGNTITLDGGREPLHYFVGENRLTQLALDGSRITGALADHYVLAKVSDN